MSEKRRNALMIRWSTVTTLAIAVVWSIWYFGFNGAPATEITFKKNWVWPIPFGDNPLFSFFSYLLVGPVYIISLVLLIFKVKQSKNSDELTTAVSVGILMGLVISVFYSFGVRSALGMSILIFIIYAIVFGFAYTLFISLVKNPIAAALTGLAASWSYTFVASLFINPIVGAITAFFFNAGVGLVFFLTFGIKYFFTRTSFGIALKEWFLAKNQ